ncbi:hypothetical protein E2C01_042441 [Portunus trituberculatus]|uniref:Uncharacterized protein n=1 Tax=Portunus trituberculatus TaxID=210409 RepID=A0A5B7FLV9_PORTR|nr:hypothetical protein [Portunus trituberculatus]
MGRGARVRFPLLPSGGRGLRVTDASSASRKTQTGKPHNKFRQPVLINSDDLSPKQAAHELDRPSHCQFVTITQHAATIT